MREFPKTLYKINRNAVFSNLLTNLSDPSLEVWSGKVYDSYLINLKNFKKQVNLKATVRLEALKALPTNSFSARVEFDSTPDLASLLNLEVYYLKKEKLYTKLKYSRSPQYDIVSGGVAALFSAFIGFLISEKFGIELVDSGDFYVLFMYGVFISFSIRPLVKIINKFNKVTPIISLLPFIDLVRTFSLFALNKARSLYISLISNVRTYF